MQQIGVPRGIERNGSALPSRGSASGPDIRVAPTLRPRGAKMQRFWGHIRCCVPWLGSRLYFGENQYHDKVAYVPRRDAEL